MRWSESDLQNISVDAEVRESPDHKPSESSRNKSGPPLRLEIEADVPSLNDYYAGEHWSERKKTRDQWHLLIKSKAPNIRIEDYPVSVECEVRFGDGRKRLDSINTAAVCKLITDGLRACGVLEEDSPEYVQEVTLRSTTHDGPTTVVYTIHD